MAESMRIQFTVNEDQQAELAIMRELANADTRKLMDNALSLLKWALKERALGHQIASVDPDRNVRVITMPLLDSSEERGAALVKKVKATVGA